MCCKKKSSILGFSKTSGPSNQPEDTEFSDDIYPDWFSYPKIIITFNIYTVFYTVVFLFYSMS